MWKPDEVVSRHKRWAVTLWMALIVAIISYAAWLIYKAVQKLENPATSVTLSNIVYQYPDIWVCLYDFYGCDAHDLEEECVSSVNDTEGGTTRATYHLGGENEQNISTSYVLTEERGWCIIIEASEVEAELGNERDPNNYLDYILLDIYWYPGGYANSTTCVVSEDDWTDHSESVFLFLNDSETGVVSTGIQVSYSCMTNASSSHVFNYVGMGLTQEIQLNDAVVSSYKALSTSSAIYKDERDADITGIENPYAYLAIEIAQEPDSWTTILEINPLEVAEIFGNIGGFWDLLAIFWPIFFVMTSRQDPFLKTRNFKKSVAKATETAMNVPAFVACAVTRRKFTANCTSEGNEKIPDWDHPGDSSGNQHGCGVLVRSFHDHGLIAVINAAPVKKFIKAQFHAKSLKEGATEASLQKLLPPKTYLIVAPPDSTTTSIAKAVMAHCRAGGDAKDNADAKPIAVKATRAKLSVLQSLALSASTYVDEIDEVREESDNEVGEAACGPLLVPSVAPVTSSSRISCPNNPQRINSQDSPTCVRRPVSLTVPLRHSMSTSSPATVVEVGRGQIDGDEVEERQIDDGNVQREGQTDGKEEV